MLLIALSLLISVLAAAPLKLQQLVINGLVILLIRERLYTNHVADEVAETTHLPGRGTLVTMLPADAEAVAAFAGAAIATPLMQIGRLASVSICIVASQPWLGLLALAVVAPQAVVVVALPSRINRRVRERVAFFCSASTIRVRYAMPRRSLGPMPSDG